MVEGLRTRVSTIVLVALLGSCARGDGTSREESTPAARAGRDADVHEPMLAHADKVASYTLRATLDPIAHTVHGEGTITWRNASTRPVSELWLHLYLNAFKNQSSEFLRAPIGGFRGATVPSDWGAIDVRSLVLREGETRTELWSKSLQKHPGEDDETEARVPLPREIQPGESLTLDVVWDDKLPQIVERTGYDGSFHMVAQWFPKIAKLESDGSFAHFPFHHLGEFYADFGQYDVTLDVPKAFTIGATGPTVETREENGRRIERHVQDDIHDFSWTAWDRFETRKERIADVDVTMLYPPGSDDDAERELDSMRFALPYFGERYGAYPYSVLTLVHPPSTAPEAGGMEYPTLITTGSLGSEWTPRGIRLVELTTIHEFGHQYFYGLVASNEDRWPFLDEGLNSYAEADALVAWKGPGSAASLFGLKVGDVEVQAERARHFGHDQRVAESADAFATGSAYGALVYSRTATILETLSRVYGREAFARAMGVYARRFRFKHPTPEDFIGTMAQELGGIDKNVGDTLRTALFEKGWVDYAITSTSSRVAHAPWGMFDRDGKRETVSKGSEDADYTGWVLVVRRGTLSFPVDVELVAEDGTRSRVPWDGVSESIRVPYRGTSPLRAAVVDPDSRVLLDEVPENNFTTAAFRKKAGAPRVHERAIYWAELVMGWLAP